MCGRYAASGHHGDVRRVATFTAAWLVAAAVAVAVAWQGVGIVTTKVTDERPGPLSSTEVRELASGATSTTTAVTTPTTAVTSPTTVASTQPTVSTPTTVRTTPTPTPTTVATASPNTTVTTSPSSSSPPPPSETRTYNVVGGSAALKFASTGVTVLWATPNSGFEVSVEPENVNGVRVEFESDEHRSRVDGWWDNGPVDRVREEPR